METSCTFTVESFTPTDWAPDITTALGVGHAHIVKRFEGGLVGRSVAQFSAAYEQSSGVGTYVAMESFDGTLDGRPGAFNFAHTATTTGGPERLHALLVVVPSSGTAELAGITGTGELSVDEDGTHRITLTYDLPG